MVILRTRNKITDFLMILAWASPFNGVKEERRNFNSYMSNSLTFEIRYIILRNCQGY